jgi:hypothetical protein
VKSAAGRVLALAACAFLAAAAPPQASRPADKGCVWKTLTSKQLGLEVKHQRCDFGYRIIDFVVLPGKPHLYQTMEDTGKKAVLYPVVTVYKMKRDEGPEEAIKRVAFSPLSLYKRKHCLVVQRRLSYLGAAKAAYTLAPDKKYAEKALEAADGDIPEPPCGELGELADSLTYFEFHPTENPERFLFVSAGQDLPMFDETSLKLLR